MKKLKVKHAKLIEFHQTKRPNGGKLFIGEINKQLPFEVRRVFTVHGLDYVGSVSGDHVHKTDHEVVFCIQGSAIAHLDDGKNTQTIKLDNPAVGIYWQPGLWHRLSDFSKGCIL